MLLKTCETKGFLVKLRPISAFYLIFRHCARGTGNQRSLTSLRHKNFKWFYLLNVTLCLLSVSSLSFCFSEWGFRVIAVSPPRRRSSPRLWPGQRPSTGTKPGLTSCMSAWHVWFNVRLFSRSLTNVAKGRLVWFHFHFEGKDNFGFQIEFWIFILLLSLCPLSPYWPITKCKT